MTNLFLYQSLSRFLLLFFTLGIFSPAFSISNVEVALTVPIETNLQVKGIPSTVDVWLKMIRSAKTSVDLEQFYILHKSGEALEPVLDALKEASGRGVKVRFLVDSKFYKTYPQVPNELAELDNMEVKTIDFSSTDGIQHSKYFIVDQSEVFVGSANFDWLALTHIHEVGLRVADPEIAASLAKVFNADWNEGEQITRKTPRNTDLATFDNTSTDSAAGIKLVASPQVKNPKGVPETLPDLLNLINTAQDSLRIQVYQYSTKLFNSNTKWTTLDTALRKAAGRGVKVRLLVDAVALKSAGKDLKSLNEVTNIQVKAVTIPEWSGGHLDYARLIHSKYLISGTTAAWVGTENWSGDYFTKSRNVGFIVNAGDIVGQLIQIYDTVWNSSYAKTPK